MGYERSKNPAADLWIRYSTKHFGFTAQNKYFSRYTTKRQIALELFGKHTRIRNSQTDLSSKSQARLRLIKSRGWKVLLINAADWVVLSSLSDKKAYLAKLLKGAD